MHSLARHCGKNILDDLDTKFTFVLIPDRIEFRILDVESRDLNLNTIVVDVVAHVWLLFSFHVYFYRLHDIFIIIFILLIFIHFSVHFIVTILIFFFITFIIIFLILSTNIKSMCPLQTSFRCYLKQFFIFARHWQSFLSLYFVVFCTHTFIFK